MTVYKKKYKKSLVQAIEEDTSGDYRKLLVRLVNPGTSQESDEEVSKSWVKTVIYINTSNDTEQKGKIPHLSGTRGYMCFVFSILIFMVDIIFNPWQIHREQLEY